MDPQQSSPDISLSGHDVPTSPRSVSRRNAINAVWATPVIAATVAAPRAAASQTRVVSATSKVSVPPGTSGVWPAHQTEGGIVYGRLTFPYATITLGLSYTNTGAPLAAGEAYIQGLVTSAAKNDLNAQDLFSVSGANNNGWTYLGKGEPQHAGTGIDAAYPIWFRYDGTLATGETAPTVNFTVSSTGNIAANRYTAGGTLLYPGEELWSRPFVNAVLPQAAPLPAFPVGSARASVYEYIGDWSNTPLPSTTNRWYVNPAAA